MTCILYERACGARRQETWTTANSESRRTGRRQLARSTDLGYSRSMEKKPGVLATGSLTSVHALQPLGDCVSDDCDVIEESGTYRLSLSHSEPLI